MKIVTIKEKNLYIKEELSEFNNLADKPTEFLNFVSLLCKKYRLCVSRIAKCNSKERNLGVELQGEYNWIQMFYEYDSNILELMISVEDEGIKKNIESDINTYVNKVTYKIGDKILDNYGEPHIIQENINEPSHHLRRCKATRVKDGVGVEVYNNYICPDLN